MVGDTINLQRLCNVQALGHAWRKVRANGGGAGVDGETLRSFERDLQPNLQRLSRDLSSGRYRPQPVRRVYVPKPNGDWRALAILTIRDRIAQRAVSDGLSPLFERKFLDCSFGFRPGRSVQDAVGRVTTHYKAHKHWVVDADILDCFGTLDHAILLKAVQTELHDPPILRLIERWLHAQVFNEWQAFSAAAVAQRHDMGTYQGGAISPLLCNIYLHAFDLAMQTRGHTLVRYADDWLLLCDHEASAKKAMAAAREVLLALKLTLHPHKSQITHFERGFCFLGAFFIRHEVYWLHIRPNGVGKPASPLSGVLAQLKKIFTKT